MNLEKTVSIPSYALQWAVDGFDDAHKVFHKHVCVRFPFLRIRDRLNWIPFTRKFKRYGR